MYLRQNVTQGFIGGRPGCLQADGLLLHHRIDPLVKAVLEELMPSAADATKVVKGRAEQSHEPTSRFPYRSARSLAAP
jgi:hypothetical protein